MATLTDLFATPDFQIASHETKKELYSSWKQTVLPQQLESLPEEQRASQVAELDTFFNTYYPEPESNYLSDIVDSVQGSYYSGVDLLNTATRELGKSFENTIGFNPDTALNELFGYDAEANDKYNKEQAAAQFSERSPYIADKAVELNELLAKETTDAGRALATAKFYALNPSLATIRFAENATAAGAAIATGGLAAAGVGGSTTLGLLAGGTVEGLLSGGEVSKGTYASNYNDLIKQGFTHETADAVAKKQAHDAFTPGLVYGGLTGVVGEVLPAVKLFGRMKPAELVKRTSKKAKVATGAVSVAGEGVQGATTQAVQNAHTLSNDNILAGTLEAGVNEAVATVPVTGVLTGVDIAVPARVEDLTQEALNTEQQQDGTNDQGAATSADSLDAIAEEESTYLAIPTADQRGFSGLEGDTGQATGADTNTGEQTSTSTTPTARPEEATARAVDNTTINISTSDTITGGNTESAGVSTDTITKRNTSNRQQGTVSSAKEVANIKWDDTLTSVDTNKNDVPPDIDFYNLDDTLQQRWLDAVKDNYASIDTATDILNIQKRNNRLTGKRPTPKEIPASVVKDVVSANRITDAKYTAQFDAPTVLHSTSASVVAVSNAQPTTLPGTAGKVNSVAVASKPKGTYIIIDKNKNTATLMSKAGSVLDSTVATATEPSQHAVSKVNVKTKGARKKNNNGYALYNGLTVPTKFSESISKQAFSGDVYVVDDSITVSQQDAVYQEKQTQSNAADSVDPLDEIKVSHFTIPLTAKVIEIIRGGATLDATTMDIFIEEAKGLPFFQKTLKALKAHVSTVKIGEILRASYGGAYKPKSDSIVINTNQMQWHTLTHEIAHAATAHALQNNSVKTRLVVKELKEVFGFVEQVMDSKNVRGATNILEFVAELYSNPNFRNELNTVQRPGQGDATQWDVVKRKVLGVLGIQSEFSTDAMIDWTEALFSTSRELKNSPFLFKGDKSLRNWDDKIAGRTKETVIQPPSSIKSISDKAFALKMAVREKAIDSTAPFLKFLNLNSNVEKKTSEFDSQEVYGLFKLAPLVRNKIKQLFDNNQMRAIKIASREVYEKYKDNGENAQEIFELIANFATAAHIPNATRVARAKIVAELEAAQAVVAEYEAIADKPEETRTAEEMALIDNTNYEKILTDMSHAETTLYQFNTSQSNKGLDEEGKPLPAWTIQGGLTAPMAEEALVALAKRLGGENRVEEAMVDLRKMQKMYIEAHRDLWVYARANGEVTEAQYQEHIDSGLAEDYIPFTGRDLDEAAEAQVDLSNWTTATTSTFTGQGQNPFGATRALDARGNKTRKGRRSAPEDAFQSLTRNLDNIASRVSTRKFKLRLLKDIQDGKFKREDVFSKKYQPGKFTVNNDATVKPLYLITEQGTYEFGINDEHVMNSLRGIADENYEGAAVRAVGRTTRFAARTHTYLNAMFPWFNVVRDSIERGTNIVLRDVRDANGNKVNKAVLAAKMTNNLRDWGLTKDSWALYRARDFSSKPIQNEGALVKSKLGRYLLEAENMGAIQTETDSITDLFKSTSTKEKALKKKVAGKLNRYYAESLSSGEKLTPKQIKNFLKDQGDTLELGIDGLQRAVDIYHRMFDIRATVAVYAAMRDVGVTKEQAAFRTQDLMNYHQRGTHTQILNAMYPFLKPILNGGANLNRSLFKKEGVVMYGALTLVYLGIWQAAREIAGDDDEDQNFVYNRVDGVNSLTTRGNIPLFISEDKDTYFKVPVAYGMHRLASTAANMALRTLNDDNVIKGRQNMAVELAETYFEEVLPIQSQINPLTDPGRFAVMQLTPEMLRGEMSILMNVNTFNGKIDAGNIKIGQEFGSGYFGTEEYYKKVAEFAHDKLGIGFTPQQVKVLLASTFPGVTHAWIDAKVSGDRGSKGRTVSSTDQLGALNVFGLNKLFNRAPAPETNVFFDEANNIALLRTKYAKEVKTIKYNKNGGVSKRFGKKWEWDEAKVAKEKPLLKAEVDLVDEYVKKRKAASKPATKMYDEILIKVNKQRKLDGDPDRTHLYQTGELEKHYELFLDTYNDTLALEREFINKLIELRKK